MPQPYGYFLTNRSSEGKNRLSDQERPEFVLVWYLFVLSWQHWELLVFPWNKVLLNYWHESHQQLEL